MEIKGIGIDLVDIDEFKQTACGKRGKGFVSRSFTKKEIAYAASIGIKPFCPLRLAANFAAKEAAFKAFGTGWIDGKDVELVHGKSGAPKLSLKGEIGKIKKKRKVGEALVSLAYTGCHAVAVVILTS